MAQGWTPQTARRHLPQHGESFFIGSGTGARTSAVDAAAALLLEAARPAKYMKIFCTASGAS